MYPSLVVPQALSSKMGGESLGGKAIIYVPLVQELVTSCQLCCKFRFPVNIDIIRSLGQSPGRPLPTNICQGSVGRRNRMEKVSKSLFRLGRKLTGGFLFLCFSGALLS